MISVIQLDQISRECPECKSKKQSNIIPPMRHIFQDTLFCRKFHLCRETVTEFDKAFGEIQAFDSIWRALLEQTHFQVGTVLGPPQVNWPNNGRCLNPFRHLACIDSIYKIFIIISVAQNLPEMSESANL